MSWYGSAMKSRASGRVSAFIMSAASVTVRVIGPTVRPRKGGYIGTRPSDGFNANTPL